MIALKTAKHLFILVIVAFFLCFIPYKSGYFDFFDGLPRSTHLWRQSDALAMTLSYTNEKLPLLKPRVLNLISNKNRACVSEFPISYYLGSKLWNTFGYSLSRLRYFNFFIFLLGLIALYYIAFSFSKNVLLSTLAPITLTISPMLLFYVSAFISNPIGIAFVFIGFCFLLFNKHNIHPIPLAFSVLFLSMACAIKIINAIPIMALLTLMIWDLLRKNSTPHKLKMTLILSIPILISVLWLVYASWYNAQNASGIFLFRTLDLFHMNGNEIKAVITNYKQHWHPLIYSTASWAIVTSITLVSIGLSIIRRQKIHGYFLLCCLGYLVYFLMFFKAFYNHDYYFIEFFPLLAMAIIVFALEINHPKWLAILLLPLVYYYLEHQIPYLNQTLSERYNGWRMDRSRFYFNPLSKVGLKLKKMGYTYKDAVISIPDESINSSLFLLQHIGWTDFGEKCDNAAVIEKRKNMGAKLLIVNDSNYLDTVLTNPYPLVLESKNVRVYDLNK